MGIVFTEITLKNVKDGFQAQDGLIKEQEIRQKTIMAVVDTGAGTLVINEELCLELGLNVRGTKQATMANNKKETVKIADPVEIFWKNRSMICQPWVISGNGKILLGAIPLEEMDIVVDPAKLELMGAHGEEPVGYLL